MACHIPQALNRAIIEWAWWSNNCSFVFHAGKCFATLDSPDSWTARQRVEVQAVQEKLNGKREALVLCFGLECNVCALLDPFEFLMM